jgi:hypothetical protein
MSSVTNNTPEAQLRQLLSLHPHLLHVVNDLIQESKTEATESNVGSFQSTITVSSPNPPAKMANPSNIDVSDSSDLKLPLFVPTADSSHPTVPLESFTWKIFIAVVVSLILMPHFFVCIIVVILLFYNKMYNRLCCCC